MVTYMASAVDSVDGAVQVTCTPASGATFAVGATTVMCSARDQRGNTATGTFTVTVQDTTPPVLTLLSPPVAVATSAAGAVVTYTASAADSVDGAVQVTCTPASGATFAVGATTVMCSARDQRGNTATSGFTVQVAPLPPTIPDRQDVIGTLIDSAAPDPRDRLSRVYIHGLPPAS